MRRNDKYLLAGAAAAAYVWYSSQTRGRVVYAYPPGSASIAPGPASIGEIITGLTGLLRSLAMPQPAAVPVDVAGLPTWPQYEEPGEIADLIRQVGSVRSSY